MCCVCAFAAKQEWKCVRTLAPTYVRWEHNKPGAFQLRIGKIKRAAAARRGDCVSLYFKFNPFLSLAWRLFLFCLELSSEHIFVTAGDCLRCARGGGARIVLGSLVTHAASSVLINRICSQQLGGYWVSIHVIDKIHNKMGKM